MPTAVATIQGDRLSRPRLAKPLPGPDHGTGDQPGQRARRQGRRPGRRPTAGEAGDREGEEPGRPEQPATAEACRRGV